MLLRQSYHSLSIIRKAKPLVTNTKYDMAPFGCGLNAPTNNFGNKYQAKCTVYIYLQYTLQPCMSPCI